MAKVRSAPWIQKTQPAGTCPVRPCSFGAGYRGSTRGAGGVSSGPWNEMAIGEANGFSTDTSRSFSARQSRAFESLVIFGLFRSGSPRSNTPVAPGRTRALPCRVTKRGPLVSGASRALACRGALDAQCTISGTLAVSAPQSNPSESSSTEMTSWSAGGSSSPTSIGMWATSFSEL